MIHSPPSPCLSIVATSVCALFLHRERSVNTLQGSLICSQQMCQAQEEPIQDEFVSSKPCWDSDSIARLKKIRCYLGACHLMQTAARVGTTEMGGCMLMKPLLMGLSAVSCNHTLVRLHLHWARQKLCLKLSGGHKQSKVLHCTVHLQTERSGTSLNGYLDMWDKLESTNLLSFQ